MCPAAQETKFLKEIRYEGVNWIQLAQDRVQWWDLMNMVISLQVP
jgi:hypothetical protein